MSVAAPATMPTIAGRPSLVARSMACATSSSRREEGAGAVGGGACGARTTLVTVRLFRSGVVTTGACSVAEAVEASANRSSILACFALASADPTDACVDTSKSTRAEPATRWALTSDAETSSAAATLCTNASSRCGSSYISTKPASSTSSSRSCCTRATKPRGVGGVEGGGADGEHPWHVRHEQRAQFVMSD